LKLFFFLLIFEDAQGVYHLLDETRSNPNGVEVNLTKNILKYKNISFF